MHAQPAQRRRRQCADEVIEPRLVHPPVRFQRSRDASSRLSCASENRSQLEAGSKRLREKGRKTIVAADDTEHLFTPGDAFVGELVGERQQ